MAPPSTVSNWVYILSDFTPEALLLEALFIFFLCSMYAAFWILKKRRFGVIDTDMPSGPVKVYLNQLIFNAEQLRAQLFGLLGQMTPPQPWSQTSFVPAAGATQDPDLARKLAELEKKLSEQTQAVEQISQVKTQLAKELEDARKALDGQPAFDTSKHDAEIARLLEKIKNLEARLAEYSVIEDDLANLKRFQQENAQLKQALAAAGGAAGAAGAGSSAPAGAPAEETLGGETIAEPPLDTVPEPVEEPEPPRAAAPAPTKASAPAGAESAAQSLKNAKAAPVASGAPQIPEPTSISAAPQGTPNQSEEDLVAEFEKMLKG